MSESNRPGVAPEILTWILQHAGSDMVLVGGQALAFWAKHYEIPLPPATVTNDIDLLGTRADVKRLARELCGKAAFPHPRSLTLLAGQVIKDLSDDDSVHVDVLLNVFGDITPEKIKCCAGEHRRQSLSHHASSRYAAGAIGKRTRPSAETGSAWIGPIKISDRCGARVPP